MATDIRTRLRFQIFCRGLHFVSVAWNFYSDEFFTIKWYKIWYTLHLTGCNIYLQILFVAISYMRRSEAN